MNTLNDLTIKAIARVDAFFTVAKEEEGSEVAQGAALALLAAAVIGVVTAARPRIQALVQGAFDALETSFR